MTDNNTKVKKVLIAFIFAIAFLSSCTTTKTQRLAQKEPTILIEHSERMFWEIRRGSSSIFILGTMHVGDKDFYPIEENVLKSFDCANRLVSEIGGMEQISLFAIKLQQKIFQTITRNPEMNLGKVLSQEEINIIQKEFGDDYLNNLLKCEPWILSLSLADILYLKAGLNAQEGIDFFFIDRAGNRKIEALESIETQLSILSAGTFDEQLEVLQNILNEVKSYEKTMLELSSLKKLYLTNNRKMLTAFFENKMDSTKGLNEYALLTERNIAWADKFDLFLSQGGTTFVFAGAAHFLGEKSVFEQMRLKGTLNIAN